MIHIDRNEFNVRSKEIMKDIEEQELRSPTWTWIAYGALAGFLASCIKFKKAIQKPFVASYTRVKGSGHGKSVD
jgi:hypothetical protein